MSRISSNRLLVFFFRVNCFFEYKYYGKLYTVKPRKSSHGHYTFQMGGLICEVVNLKRSIPNTVRIFPYGTVFGSISRCVNDCAHI